MTFWQSICHCMRHYADFSGRARRSEYWWFALFLLLGALAAAQLGKTPRNLFLLACALPALAVACRRLHDTGRSGWWQLVGMLPVVGLPALLLLLSLPGKREDTGWAR
jgi:uncharacterized membrane protein YhaH (DUF805 family)